MRLLVIQSSQVHLGTFNFDLAQCKIYLFYFYFAYQLPPLFCRYTNPNSSNEVHYPNSGISSAPGAGGSFYGSTPEVCSCYILSNQLFNAFWVPFVYFMFEDRLCHSLRTRIVALSNVDQVYVNGRVDLLSRIDWSIREIHKLIVVYYIYFMSQSFPDCKEER